MPKNTPSAKKITAMAFALIFAFSAIVAFPLCDDSQADSSISITDGDGHTITIGGAVNHVVAIGKGASATVIELGQTDKIVVTDVYSNTASESVFQPLKDRVAAGNTDADGSMYNSGLSALKINIVDAADGDKFDKDNDVVILSGGSSANTQSVYNYLVGLGFKKVLSWSSINSYDQIIDFVEAISKVVTGGVASQVSQMKNVRDSIKDTLASHGITDANKHKCFYVTWTSSTLKVGNTGSLGTSILQAAGGKVVTVDGNIAATTYETSIPDLISTNGTDIVVAADNSVESYGKTATLITQVGEGPTVVPMQSLWNNYSIDSMYGVWTMACAMYPEYFSGDVPALPDGGNNNTMIYIIGGAVGAVVIIGIAVFFMKRH